MKDNLRHRYLQVLSPWPAAMRPYLYALPSDASLACYGPGNQGHWAMQANATAAAAFAVLATDPELDPRQADMSRDEMHDWALRMIRFGLRSHRAGGGQSTDQGNWGNSWISALSLERLMHGLEALDESLTTADRDLLHRVLLSEADWLLDHYQIVAGLVNDNKPESNIWNGSLLHRLARLLPTAPRRQDYLDQGTRFLLNGISIPEDAQDATPIDGRPLSAWHVGANLFSTYACNHHGYLNVGYMVICLSNLAMLHFSCRANGWTPPTALAHHARELWRLVKTCTFADGRLWRIGGDTRVRYCYCQDYAIPTWLWARDALDDPQAETFEDGWLRQVETEVASNPDHSFLGGRLARLRAVSPLYYLRLEGDRACTLSMGAYWRRRHEQHWPPAKTAKPAADLAPLAIWSDDYHGSCLVRGRQRLASWTWRAAKSPQGLCLPTANSAMAEWQGNLGGRILGLGLQNDANCQPGQCRSFDGGFATCGQATVHTQTFAAEGEQPADIARLDLACVALPDDRTMVVIQRARTLGRSYLREVKGLFLQIPNDLFNGNQRRYHTAERRLKLGSRPGTAETLAVAGDWLNADNQLGVLRVYGPALAIHRPADRQIAIRNLHAERAGGSLYADEICCGCQTELVAHDANTELFDLAVVLLAGIDAGDTAKLAAKTPPTRLPLAKGCLRGVKLAGADGKQYWVIANFSTTEQVAEIAAPDSGSCLRLLGDAPAIQATNAETVHLVLAPMAVTVVAVGR